MCYTEATIFEIQRLGSIAPQAVPHRTLGDVTGEKVSHVIRGVTGEYVSHQVTGVSQVRRCYRLQVTGVRRVLVYEPITPGPYHTPILVLSSEKTKML